MKRKGANIEIEESRKKMKRKGANIEIEESRKKMKRKGANIEIEENRKKKKNNREEKRIQIISWNEKSGGPHLHICKGKGASKQHMDVDQAMSEEIIMEILSRLPVLSLQRFKCVSTFWEALISDPYFKMKHLNYAKNDQNSQKLLGCQWPCFQDDIYSFYCSSLSSVQVVDDEQKLDCPSNYKPTHSRICASSDGLVLLHVSDGVNEQLLLWNPSTRESIVLPYPESTVFGFVSGFGYDATSDDYKILMINLNANDRENISAKILALKSGSWRKINKYPTGIRRVKDDLGCGMDTLAFVHGAFHWLGLSRNYMIFSFDISNEVYGEIPLLERMRKISNTRRIDLGVIVLREMLCFHSTHDSGWGRIFKLLVMKDYGVKESWTQLLTIEGTNIFYQAIPKYMFVDGEVLLLCRYAGRFVYVTSRGPFDLWPERFIVMHGIVYTESLLSPRLLI